VTESAATPHFLVLSGVGVGRRLPLPAAGAVLGRHPDVELPFDRDGDLEVSGRHAELRPSGSGWWIRDLGSRNGTFVNGERITDARPLGGGDRVRLGPGGPLLEFRLVAPAEGSISQMVRARAARQTAVLRRTAGGLVALLFLATAGFGMREWHQRSEWARERGTMQARIDSVLAAGEVSASALQGQVAALSSALTRSQEEVSAARDELAKAERGRGGGGGDIPRLRAELQSALAELARQQEAAGLDFRGIQRRNQPAVALVFVESSTGEVSTATAFAVRRDAVLLTNRHAVLGPGGNDQPRRIAIQFSGSRQVWPARLIASSREIDLAAVKVDNIVGDVPTVGPLNLRSDTLAAGAPVALIGFPLGGANGSEDRSRPARPLLSAGVISGVEDQLLEVRGFGAAGGSGSPLFDRNGQVAGILFGGRHDAAGRQTLLAVPAAAAAKLLAAIR
jgi:S1-C subfamily serine protease